MHYGAGATVNATEGDTISVTVDLRDAQGNPWHKALVTIECGTPPSFSVKLDGEEVMPDTEWQEQYRAIQQSGWKSLGLKNPWRGESTY